MGEKKLSFPAANSAAETACEELSERHSPWLLSHHSTRNREWAATAGSSKCSSLGVMAETLPGTWVSPLGCSGRDSQAQLFCSQQASLGLSTALSTCGARAGTELLLLAAGFAAPQNLPVERGSWFPSMQQKGFCPSCDALLLPVAAVCSRFSVAHLGACFVSSQRALPTNSPHYSIKEVRKFWILFFWKKWLILHTVFLHFSLIYDVLIEAGGVWRKFLFKFT